MKKTILFVVTLFIINCINGQTITTFATGFNSIEGIAVNSNNEVFISEHNSGNIFKIDNNDNSSLYGTTNLRANNIIFNANDELFVSEPFMNKIWHKIQGSTLTEFLSVNNDPNSLVFTPNGDLLFSSINKIFKIDTNLNITEFATSLQYPEGIALDSQNNLYIAERGANRLSKIDASGNYSIVAENIHYIRGLAIDYNDNVYVTTENSYPVENKILKYDPTTNAISDYVTTGLDSPRHIAIDNLGNMYVTNLGNNTVVKIHDNVLVNNNQVVNIPDPNFKSYLLSISDINSDGEIQITEANNYTGDIIIYNDNTINNVQGIEAFINVNNIFLSGSNITGNLNISNFNNLTSLKAFDSDFNSISVSNCNALTLINCYNNSLTDLNITYCPSLEEINCYNNQLTNLDFNTNPNLKTLRCGNNQISSLNLDSNQALEYLSCFGNQLTTINFENNSSLKKLFCGGNEINSIDVSSNIQLQLLFCNQTNITSLDLSNNINLESLYCYMNYQLHDLDLSNNTELKYLSTNHTPLYDLDVSNNIQLEHLECSGSQLSSLDVSNNPQLKYLECILNNGLTELDLSHNHYLESLICRSNLGLSYINLKNGNNANMIISGNSNVSRFSELPNLQDVCVDALNTNLTNYITSEVGHNVNFYTDCSLASIDDNNLATFTIFPNPTNNIINIEADFAIDSITLFNGAGQILSIKNNSDTLDISKLSEGVYFIKIQTKDNKFYTKKIIKN